MFLRIAYTLVLALAAIVSLTAAPAIAQTGTSTVVLNCTWNGIIYRAVPDNGRTPGAFRVEAAACGTSGTKSIWLLPLPGGVTGTFSSPDDLTAYLKASYQIQMDALGSKDGLVKELRAEIAKLTGLLAKTNAGELAPMLAAAEVDLIKVRDQAVAAINERAALAERLKAAEAEIAALKAAASKPAGS